MKNINTKEILTQHFVELSEKIKNCNNTATACQLTELFLKMYDRLEKQEVTCILQPKEKIFEIRCNPHPQVDQS